jgi:hypothetical protein
MYRCSEPDSCLHAHALLVGTRWHIQLSGALARTREETSMQIKVLTKLTEMAEILPGGGRWNRQRSALLTSVARQRRNRLPALGLAGR